MAFKAEIPATGIAPEEKAIGRQSVSLIGMHLMTGAAGQLAFPVQGKICGQGEARLHTNGMGHGKADITMAAEAEGFNIGNKKISSRFPGLRSPQVALHTLHLIKVGGF